MSEIKKGAVLKTRKEVVDCHSMKTLLEAGEVVRCAEIVAPVAGRLYTVRVERFGTADTEEIRIPAESFDNFEVIR